MGTPDYAGIILDKIFQEDGISVKAVFTQPDKPVGRKQILTSPYVKKMIIEKGVNVDVFQPKSLKDKNIVKIIKDIEPDFIVVAAYGQILPREILDIAPCINLHASLLPKYRGASPIQSAILNEDIYSGVTAMLMNEGLDTGDMLGYAFVKIEEDMMVEELFERLSCEASKLTIEILKNFESLKPLKQFDILSSYAKKINRSDGEVDFEDCKKLYLKYKAFTPWPGIFLKNGLKLKKVMLSNIHQIGKIGEILHIESEYITVLCKNGAIDIVEVQPSSKKVMNSNQYIKGKRLKVGDTFF